MDSMELGVLSDMPHIRKKACSKLFKQQVICFYILWKSIFYASMLSMDVPFFFYNFFSGASPEQTLVII